MTNEAASGSPYGMGIGEVMNRLCREAGLEIVQLTASLRVMPVTAATSVNLFTDPLGERAIGAGIITREELDELIAGLEKRLAAPDAYIAFDFYEIVARKP